LIPIDALIGRVSRMAEQMFDKQDDVDPIWLVESASGEQHTIISPIVAPSGLAAGDYKDKLAAKMRETFADLDVVRYARATECWMVKDPAIDPDSTEEQLGLHCAAMGYTLKNHPNRREVVKVEPDAGSELIPASRDITRPAPGKPYLGKLSAIERPTRATGRFLNLLPGKGYAEALRERPQHDSTLPRICNSSELPDD